MCSSPREGNVAGQPPKNQPRKLSMPAHMAPAARAKRGGDGGRGIEEASSMALARAAPPALSNPYSSPFLITPAALRTLERKFPARKPGIRIGSARPYRHS